MKEMNKRYGFLDGMRTIVCLFVFLGHFFVDFCITDIFPMQSPVYRAGILLFYGCYTVPLFCAISGFLAVQKEIGRGWDLTLASLNRFLRFELPLLFLMAAILFLNKKGLFAYGDLLAERLSNKQLAGNYTFESHYTWLFRKAFWDLSVYDNPLWMIGSLFFGNLFLYAFKYVQFLCHRYLQGWKSRAIQLASMASLFFFARSDIPQLAVLLGGCYGLVRQFFQTKSSIQAAAGQNEEEGEGCQKASRQPFLAYGILLLLAILNGYLYFLKDFDFERFPRHYEWAGLATALGLLFAAFSCRPIQKILEAKVFTRPSGLSFAVYAIHYPLIGLLSCPLIYALYDRIPYKPLVALTFAVTAGSCMLLAFAYNKIIEKPCYALIRKLIGFLREN